MSDFELAGIRIPIRANLQFNQTYEPIGGTHTFRTQNGRAVKQTHFNKLKTTLSGTGWMPAGLDGIDYSEPLILKCAAPRSFSSSTNQISLPSNRRIDKAPIGFALVDGELLVTQCHIQESMAVLDIKTNAQGYQVLYYPELLVFAEPPVIQSNIHNTDFSWRINCEEC